MNFKVHCPKCGWKGRENVLPLICETCEMSALLQLDTDHISSLLDKCDSKDVTFSDFLPWLNQQDITEQVRVGVFRNKSLEYMLGTSPIWILFSGYYPSNKALLKSGTFKELEAISVLDWMSVFHENKVLCLSSAGNAGRALGQMAIRKKMPAIIVVPEFALKDFWIPDFPDNPPYFLIAIRDGVYQNAIHLVDILSKQFSDRLIKEGGVYNIARRSALGFPYFQGCLESKSIPYHYIQAVGSATGAIASHEINKILSCSASFKSKTTKIHIAQNFPFVPIVDAWNSGSQEISFTAPEKLDSQLSKVKARVLSNANPPYSVVGGIRDILSNSDGNAYSITNDEITQAQKMWSDVDSIDLDPASFVAIAALKKALGKGNILQGESVMLHLTGGGLNGAVKTEGMKLATPSIVVDKFNFSEVIKEVDDYLSNVG